jgi:type IV pilus assembly protein PilY1
MAIQNRFIKPLLLSTLLGPALSGALLADDTEVYVGSNQVLDARPNLVFIIDTSGSMNTEVKLAKPVYDPTVTYSGTCDADSIFWGTGKTPPSCSSDYYIVRTSFKCNDAHETLFGTSGSGFYTGRAARYKSRGKGDRWDSLSDSEHTEWIECEADWGVHGETTGSTAVYPADEGKGGPWTSTKNSSIRWKNTGSTYTFYSANYLNWRQSTGAETIITRLEVVQEVFSDLMDSVSNINLAVMRFDNEQSTISENKGGYFIMPMQQLTTDNREAYKYAVDALTPRGFTPLAETLYEAYLFYKGAPVLFGDETSPGTNIDDENLGSVLDPTDKSKYLSPIEYQCQKNFVILLTDGKPYGDNSADSAINALPGFTSITNSCAGVSGEASSSSQSCLDELAQYMYNKDCSSGLSGEQNVITYTIGFATDQALLNDAATKGGGKYYTADELEGLTDAITAIITEILAVNTSFTAPAVSVNAFNRSNHRSELYYALFRPSENPYWFGNIKRYKLVGSDIVDAEDNLAIDPNTGFTKPTAISFWTSGAGTANDPSVIDPNDSPDGDNVAKGGAASRQTLTRNVYTYTGAAEPANVALTASAHALHETNLAITKEMLGNAAMADANRTELLQWARGVDTQDDDSDGSVTDARRRMGDPLHTKPVLITYGGTDAAPDITLFAGTNEGYLHAIDTADGHELFSFMPQELLPRLESLFIDSAASPHPYGLDGPLTYWMKDLNGNGVILDSGGNIESGEHVYIYQGMRRGGKSYYALDVTNRNAPVYKWKITGGSGEFSELAQSWSAATKARIKLAGVDKDVLIFGGGYDDDVQDGADTATDDAIGRALFMVDAATGDKVWQAGPAGSSNGSNPNLVLSAMTNSIPADVNVIDTDGDGYKDRIYVGDMRGQIWRFDIDNDNNSGADDLVTGGVIARLSTNASTAHNRRFFYTPEAALSLDGSQIYIAVGSGYRAHPLNTAIQDAFFVIQDSYVYEPLRDQDDNAIYTYADTNSDGTPDSVITLADLYDATANTIGNSNSTSTQINAEQSALASKNGWYFWLNDPADDSFIGEKVLAKPLAFQGKVQFTTFTPVASSQTACAPSQGLATPYEVNLKDGTPTRDQNVDGEITREDRMISGGLTRTGIPPEPIHIYTPDGVVRCIGMECSPEDLNRTPKKIRWSQE